MATPAAIEIEALPGSPPVLIPRNYDLEQLRYLEAEFEARGQAQSYRAVGESQSAGFLATYVNGVDLLARVFDGFFLHGRPGVRAEFNGTFGPRVLDEQHDAMTDCPEQVRADARVPVLLLSSETDVAVLRNGAIEQPDSDHVRVWELAGAAHADTYLVVASRSDGGQLPPEEFARMLEPVSELTCAFPSETS